MGKTPVVIELFCMLQWRQPIRRGRAGPTRHAVLHATKIVCWYTLANAEGGRIPFCRATLQEVWRRVKHGH